MIKTAIRALVAAAFATTLAGVASAALLVNEIDYDQTGSDAAEFIEIYNPDAVGVLLSGFRVELVNGNAGGAAVYQTIALPAVTLAPGDYYVICANTATTSNCDLDVTPDGNLIQNGAPDAVALVTTAGVVVDTVSYEGNTGAPYTEGSGTGLTDTDAGVNIGISRFPNGTDTNVNNVDLSSRCITPGLPNTSLASGCQPVAVEERPWTQVKRLYQ